MNEIIEKTYRDIKSIKIQGATNVAYALANALKKYSDKVKAGGPREYIWEMEKAGYYLATARDTEPMADNVVEFLIYHLKQNSDLSLLDMKKYFKKLIEQFFVFSKEVEHRIEQNGIKLIKNKDNILTHCHASTVIKILVFAKSHGRKFKVFSTETRPLFQGRKTAQDLIKKHIKDTMLVDSSAMSVIAGQTNVKIDKIILGCDAISADGGCVNKVGSFGLALAAKSRKIPLYIATPALKINEDAKNLSAIKIEKRPAGEVWPKAPRNLQIYNFAFDKIPANYITGYITELGILKPRQLFAKIKMNYKWLF